MIKFYIISIFPKVFPPYLGESIIGRAQKEGKIQVECIDLRDFTSDNYKSVDDSPYGGGAGMVMSVEPIYKAVRMIKENISAANPVRRGKPKVILFSARGKQYSQKDAKRLSHYKDIILICGRYEGVDERVSRYIADEIISVGPYVLTGGELPAMILADSITRLLPGVLGNTVSLEEESFAKEGYLEYPQYTRPAVFANESPLISKVKSWRVPKVLLSGNHQKIKEWREDVDSNKSPSV